MKCITKKELKRYCNNKFLPFYGSCLTHCVDCKFWVNRYIQDGFTYGDCFFVWRRGESYNASAVPCEAWWKPGNLKQRYLQYLIEYGDPNIQGVEYEI